jgi:hypothetical protein
MRAETSSPGVSGQQCGQCLGLTTRDSVRQETSGAQLPGLGVKAAKKVGTGLAAEGGLLNLIRRNK